MDKSLTGLGLQDAHTCKPSNETREVCSHNEMVANDDHDYAWKCANCGYIYGSSIKPCPEPYIEVRRLESFWEGHQ